MCLILIRIASFKIIEIHFQTEIKIMPNKFYGYFFSISKNKKDAFFPKIVNKLRIKLRLSLFKVLIFKI